MTTQKLFCPFPVYVYIHHNSDLTWNMDRHQPLKASVPGRYFFIFRIGEYFGWRCFGPKRWEKNRTTFYQKHSSKHFMPIAIFSPRPKSTENITGVYSCVFLVWLFSCQLFDLNDVVKAPQPQWFALFETASQSLIKNSTSF